MTICGPTGRSRWPDGNCDRHPPVGGHRRRQGQDRRRCAGLPPSCCSSSLSWPRRRASSGRRRRQLPGLNATTVGSKPTWSFVEDGCPYGAAGWPCIQTQQIRPAVWHADCRRTGNRSTSTTRSNPGRGTVLVEDRSILFGIAPLFEPLSPRSMRRSSRWREYSVRLRWQAGSEPTRMCGRRRSGTARTSTS
jgi:hypothetical protein